MKIVDLAKAIAPDCEVEIIGIRPGEKLHEILITEEDGRYTVDYDGLYVILPQFSWWRRQNYSNAKALQESFIYASNRNKLWLTIEELKDIVEAYTNKKGSNKINFGPLSVSDNKSKRQKINVNSDFVH